MSLGERMKMYEKLYSKMSMPNLPLMARLDGRSFHNFTRKMERPFDKLLSNAMIKTSEFLLLETRAKLSYTQSDEITLCFNQDSYEQELFFNGKIDKINSILASMCSVYFNKQVDATFPEQYKNKMPIFDCRAWNVPNLIEAANNFLWREQDAARNSIQMAARCYYSHKQLIGKKRKDMHEMLFQKGINWNDYPRFFKQGTYIKIDENGKPNILEIEPLLAAEELAKIIAK